MAGFKLQDGFGLDVSVVPAAGALSRYFKSIPDMKLSTIDLAHGGETELSNPAVRSAAGDLNFSRPIDIGIAGVKLNVTAKSGGALSIFVPDKEGAALFTPDLFGDEVRVGESDRYVSMSLSAKIGAGISVPSGTTAFGFNASSSVSLSYYQLFRQPQEKVLDAVEETIANFAIPASLDDIELMPDGSIAAADSGGSLKFSATANLLAITNPLASASLPLAGTAQITGGAAISVGAAFEFSGDYQVRVQKLAHRVFHLGFYRKRGSEFSISANAQASLMAELGGNDLFTALMKAISANPPADRKALQESGLSKDQIQDIQKAIKNAVDRSLAIGASLELSRALDHEAMFLCEVDLNAIPPDGRDVLERALRGDLSGIAALEDKPVRGVVLLKTLISKTRTLQHALKVNLLGIYNFSQLSSLIVQGKIGWDRTVGELVITDMVSASKIRISQSHLEANTRNLRHVLAQHLLITAVYSAAARMTGSGPELSATQSYFDLQSDAQRLEMRNHLLLAAALGLTSEADALERMPGKVNHFGSTTVYAEAAYNNDAFYSLFFSDGNLRSRDEYTSAGRKALTYLVQRGDRDEARLLLATSDELFADLCRIGNPESTEFKDALIARRVPPEVVPSIGADYRNVMFLQDSLSSAGQALLAIRQFVAANPGIDPTNDDFKKLRGELSKRLAQFADHATEDFGGPWGFNAMALLRCSVRQKWLLVNARLTAALENPNSAIAAASI